MYIPRVPSLPKDRSRYKFSTIPLYEYALRKATQLGVPTHRYLGVSARTANEWKNGVIFRSTYADKIAIKQLGVHPCAIWTDWFDKIIVWDEEVRQERILAKQELRQRKKELGI